MAPLIRLLLWIETSLLIGAKEKKKTNPKTTTTKIGVETSWTDFCIINYTAGHIICQTTTMNKGIKNKVEIPV